LERLSSIDVSTPSTYGVIEAAPRPGLPTRPVRLAKPSVAQSNNYDRFKTAFPSLINDLIKKWTDILYRISPIGGLSPLPHPQILLFSVDCNWM
jgi:hypothetical protein